MRAGDIVFHRPSKEQWVLACVRSGYVFPCCTLLTLNLIECGRESDCDLLKSATDEEYRIMLESWSAKDFDQRSSICRLQLTELNKEYIGDGI